MVLINASRCCITPAAEARLPAPVVPLSGPIIWELLPTDHKKRPGLCGFANFGVGKLFMQLFLLCAVACLIVQLWVCIAAHTLCLLPQDNSENELILLSECFP